MKRNRWKIPIIIINVFLLENILKTYEIPIFNDKIRLLCYGLLAIVSCLFVAEYLIINKGIVRKNRVSFSIIIYLILIIVLLFLHANNTWEVLMLCSMIPFSFIMSYYCFRGCVCLKTVVTIQCIVFIVVWLLFMYSKLNLHQAGAGKLNSVFYVVLMLPFLLMLDNNNMKKILFGLLMIASIFSMKRTAIIIVVVCLIVYLWCYDKKNRTRTIKIIVALSAMAFLTILIQEKVGIDIIGKFEAMSEDGGSGRSSMYIILLDNLFKRPISQIIFGDGYYSVINIIGGTAHNDFLEIIYDFGLVGFVAYIGIYIQLIKAYQCMKRYGYEYKAQFLVSLYAFGIMSMLSHVIMIPTYMMYICLFWGIVLSDFYSKLKEV